MPLPALRLQGSELIDTKTGGQCRRSNLRCGGYNSTATFIVYKPPQTGSSQPCAQDATALGQTPSPLTISSQSLDRVSFQTRILDEYWEDFFPKAVTFHSSLKYEHMGEWAFFVRLSYSAKNLAKTALLAAGLASLGRRKGERRFQLAAMEAYSKALIELNRLLHDSEKSKSDTVLAACKVMALFEVLRLTTSLPVFSR
jgi:hypothetical protein